MAMMSSRVLEEGLREVRAAPYTSSSSFKLHTAPPWGREECGGCGRDGNAAERIANVVTSMPFIVLGLNAPRKNLKCHLYANSLIGVGIASTVYHSSSGHVRKYLRWADYAMIAASTLCLSSAVTEENPRMLMAASAACLPFQPLVVSAVHTGIMEVAFAKRALKDPELRTSHRLHKVSSVVGGILFVADDVFPATPFLHSAWHLAAAVAVATCNKLL